MSIWPPPPTPRWRLRWNGIRNRLSPRRHYNNVRWFIQRGRRGYSDCDVWNLNSYLSDVLIGALTQLKETGHSHPCSLTEQTWDDHLDKMIAGFEAARSYIDSDYMVETAVGRYEMNAILEQEMLRTHRRGIAKFAVWYLHLWD